MHRFIRNSQVLIIDDEKDIRALLKEVFEGEGAEVELAETGSDGFEKMMNSHFDIVLLDLRMPKMDGFEAIRAIRQVDPLIPIMIITGYATQENIKKCFELGANDYFSKPFDLQQIVRRAEELIKDRLESDKV
ncbi:MAG: response regulator [Candidatus Aureabacteria bacterium]|nr:response regulator [Candidatus Auribacterota bacterium]